MRIVKIVIFLSVSLVCTLLAVRFLFLDQVLVYALQKNGAEAVSIHVAGIDGKEVRLDGLQATYRLPGGDRYSVIIENASLQYDFLTLFSKRKSSQIEIARMSIALERSETRSNTEFTLPDQIEFFKDELRLKLPLESITVHHLQFYGDFPPSVLDKTMQLDVACAGKSIQAALDVLVATDTRFQVEFKSPDSLHGALDILLQKGDELPLAAKFVLYPEKITGTVNLQLESMRNFLLKAAILAKIPEGSGALSLDFDIPLSPLVQKDMLISGTLKGLAIKKVNATEIEFQLRGKAEGHGVLFAKESTVRVKELVTEEISIPELHMHLTEPLQLSLQKGGIAVYGKGVQTGFTLPTTIIDFKGQQLVFKQLSGAFQLKEKLLSGNLQLAPGNIPGRIRADFQHNLETASGNIQVKTETQLDLDGDGDSLAGLLSPWSFPFDLDGGRIAFRADGSWNPDEKLKLSSSVSVSDGRGYYKQMLFDGLNIRQDLALWPRLYSRKKGSVALDRFTSAVDVFDIQADVDVHFVPGAPLPKIQVRNLSASVFDGSISTKELLYDLNNPDTGFSVDITSVDLGRLVSLIKMDTLDVTGTITGFVPVSIKGKDYSVINGELHSDNPGGEIRYSAGGMNTSGLTGIALKAVEELRYQTLQVTANYQPSGQLDLDISFQGVSPALESTRPVHLNIHAEQNLPALLQSLRFSKGLTEELDKRVKQHYN